MADPTADVVQRLVSAVAAEAGADAERRREVLGAHLVSLDAAPREGRAWRDGVDIVGAAYERLFSGNERRSAGQFFTPFWAGELMAGWILRERARLVLDPGCGSGGLLIPAARHRRSRGARLLGIDIDPLAVAMLEANVRLRGMTNVVARQGDFLLDDLGERPDAIICNPPYSRHHAIPAQQKAAIHDGFERRLGVRFNRLAALHVLFLVRALEVAADGARIAFITPSDWLDVGYGTRIKEWLLARAQVEAIVLIEESHLFFDGALTTAAITLLRKTTAAGDATKVLRVAAPLPEPRAVLDALSANGPELRPGLVRLNPAARWSRPRAPSRTGRPLGSLARIRRGIATGSNAFFVIGERRRRELGIPTGRLKRCIGSPRVFSGVRLTAEAMDGLDDDVPRWLVDCPDAAETTRDTPVGRYLRCGLDLGVHEGYLARRREPWHRLEQRGPSPILFTYFNRASPRFVRNVCGAVPLNNWLVVEPVEGIDADALYAALSSPAVQRELHANRRVYGGGLWKLEPSELARVRLRLSG